jgi:hypothetical protein
VRRRGSWVRPMAANAAGIRLLTSRKYLAAVTAEDDYKAAILLLILVGCLDCVFQCDVVTVGEATSGLPLWSRRSPWTTVNLIGNLLLSF